MILIGITLLAAVYVTAELVAYLARAEGEKRATLLRAGEPCVRMAVKVRAAERVWP